MICVSNIGLQCPLLANIVYLNKQYIHFKTKLKIETENENENK